MSELPTTAVLGAGRWAAASPGAGLAQVQQAVREEEDYSILILAIEITLAYSAESDFISAAICSGVARKGSIPELTRFFLMSGMAKILATSVDRGATISFGVPAGATIPSQFFGS